MSPQTKLAGREQGSNLGDKPTVLSRWFQYLAKYPAPIRLLGFLLTLALLWLPFLGLGSWAIADPNWRSIITLVILYLGFIALVQPWGKIVHGIPNHLAYLGLRGGRRFFLEQFLGLWVGTALVFVMFEAEAVLGWAQWLSPGPSFLKIAIEGLLVGSGIGFAEELMFRGWMGDEFSRELRFRTSLVTTAHVFALLHFLKPWEEILRTWPQFLGLVLLGILLGYAKSITRGRLGLPMGLHGGLVWGYSLVNVGQLSQTTAVAPAWVTGIDGNPLAGLVGLTFLSLCILYSSQLHRTHRNNRPA